MTVTCDDCGGQVHESPLLPGVFVHDDEREWLRRVHVARPVPASFVPMFYLDESGTQRPIKFDANGIPRDQWKRPVIRKRDGSWSGFTRISSIAKELDTGRALKLWSNAMTAIGMTVDGSIRREVEELVAFSVNPYAEHKTRLIQLAEQAQEAAGSIIKRELGKTLHDWAQIYDRTGDLALIPREHLADITAYRDRLAEAGVTVLDSETFVVVDEIEVAGSLDKLLLLGDLGVVVVGDIKTGADEPKYPMNVEMQVAGYSRGDRYDLSTGERTPLHPNLDRDTGLLIHMPSGTGTCDLYELDLARGWQNLMLATDLKRARKVSSRRLSPLSSRSAA